MKSCRPIDPPAKYLSELARRAIAENPANCPKGITPEEEVAMPAHIAAQTSKLWSPNRKELTVSFMQTQTPAFIDKIILYANKWSCGIEFKYTTGTGAIRISTGSGGYYAYVGKDMASIPTSRHNMNLERFTVSTRDSEWDRVVTHEFGHAIAFPHEHSRQSIIDLLKPSGCYSYFGRTSGWTKQQVDQQILTVQPETGLTATETDVSSIMCYSFPGECTWSGDPIPGGLRINPNDRSFAQDMYPPDEPEPPTPPDPPDPVEPPDPEPLPDDDEWNLDNYEWGTIE